MKSSVRQTLQQLAILLAVILVAYWQIVFPVNCLKWDMIDVVLPFRYFIGECWQNGYFPFWNPYQLGGTPIYPDMQYPVFYPETFIIGHLGSYSNLTLHFLFVLYIFIAGMGMYFLAKYFKIKPEVALYTGIAYSLSGFFVGHGQAMFALVSAAWVPFVIMFFLKMSTSLRPRDALATSLFLFLLITNGYQTFTIILGYFLVVIALFFLVMYVIRKQYSNLFRLAWLNLLLAAIVVILCSPLWVSLIQVSDYTSRLGFLPLELALQNPFSPQSLISLILPAATVKNPEFFQTDLSMSNAYFGLVMLVFLLGSFFRKLSRIEYLFLGWALFCLLSSFGSYTPVREFLYHYLPMMNLFRAPSYFTLFSILGFLLLAGKSISELNTTSLRWTKLLILPLAVIFLSAAFYSFPKIDFAHSGLGGLGNLFYESIQKTTFHEHIFIQSLFQLIILSGLLLTISRNKISVQLIGFLLSFEMIFAVQFNMYYTVASHKNPVKLYHQLKEKPSGFPLPEPKPLNENTDISGAFLPVWRNTHIFHKSISFGGFSSFVFDDFIRLVDDYPNLLDAVLSNPPVYLSNHIEPVSQINNRPIAEKEILYVDDSFFVKYSYLHSVALNRAQHDTAFFVHFAPNNIVIHTESESPALLVILQSQYKGWSARVNGKETPIITTNLLFRGIEVPAGKAVVELHYQNKIVKILFLVTMVLFLCIISCILFIPAVSGRKNKN